jgi:hypothetical protein
MAATRGCLHGTSGGARNRQATASRGGHSRAEGALPDAVGGGGGGAWGGPTDGPVEADDGQPPAPGPRQRPRRHNGVRRRPEAHVPHHEPAAARRRRGGGGLALGGEGALDHAGLADVEPEGLGLRADPGVEGLPHLLPAPAQAFRTDEMGCERSRPPPAIRIRRTSSG